MNAYSKVLAAALLALCLPLAAAPPARAADVSLQISFGNSPRWVAVPGTRVREVRMEDRTNYDVFQYGGRFYAYNQDNDRWYTSRRSNGRYKMISYRQVPRELRRIPRDHWRNYPSEWETSSRRDVYRGDNNAPGISISFGTSPRWTTVEGTNVQVMYGSANPDYDVFRYGTTYYAYDGTRWYSSGSEGGRFVVVQESAVPDVFYQVPRERWHHEPPAGNRGHGRGNSEGHRQDGR